MITPGKCRHRHQDNIESSSMIGGESTFSHDVYICRDCGQFTVRGWTNGEYFNVSFALVLQEHVEAAGILVRELEAATQRHRNGHTGNEPMLGGTHGL